LDPNPESKFFFPSTSPKKLSGASGGSDKGLLWNLPVVKTKDLGKLFPGIGFGAGCGAGLFSGKK